jgi:UDP-glucose 4-epimerase
VPYFLGQGAKVRVLDKDENGSQALGARGADVMVGGVEDRSLVRKAVQGVDAVIHLAWSFSDDPCKTIAVDVMGQANLLEASAEERVRHFIYTSSAVVYGKPCIVPITEDHPLPVESSRKPMYALAKVMTEKLGFIVGEEQGLPFTNLRFWWAFGEEIGGRHLRELVRTALRGETLCLPGEAGGSFLHLDDFALGVEAALFKEAAYGETFNLASFYITWEEVGRMIVDLAGSGYVDIVSPDDWTGSSFLVDVWNLSFEKASRMLGYAPALGEDLAKETLKKAIQRCVDAVASQPQVS